jgi:hypothetical protein
VRTPSIVRSPPAWVLAAGAYVLLAVALFGHAWADPLHRWVGAPQDAPLFVWAMRWWPWAVGHGHNPLFSHFLGVPRGVNLTWVTSVPALSLALAPVTLLLGPIFSYNAAATLAVAASALSAFVVIGRVVTDRRAAFAGGLLFGFSPFIVAQSLGHLMLSAAFLVPLFALVVGEVVVVQRRRPWQSGVALGLLAAIQFYVGEELLAIVMLSTAVAVASIAICHRGDIGTHWRHALRAGLVAAAVGLVVVAPALVFQLAGPGRLHGPLQPQDRFVADATAFVVPTPVQHYHPLGALRVSSRYAAAGAEYDAYLGVPLLLVLGLVLVAERRRRWVLATGLATALVALLACGPHLHIDGHRTWIALPWDAAGRLPLLESLLPVRFMVVVDFFAGVLLAVALDRLLRLPRPVATIAAAGVAGSIAFTLWPALPFPATAASTPQFFRTAAVRSVPAGSVALVAPYAEPATSQVLVWQAESGFRFRLLGATFPVPGPHGRPEFVGEDNIAWRVIRLFEQGQQPNAADPPLRNEMADFMRADGIDSVLVGPMPNAPRLVAFFTVLLGRPPVYQGGVYRWTAVLELLRAQPR